MIIFFSFKYQHKQTRFTKKREPNYVNCFLRGGGCCFRNSMGLVFCLFQCTNISKNGNCSQVKNRFGTIGMREREKSEPGGSKLMFVLLLMPVENA